MSEPHLQPTEPTFEPIKTKTVWPTILISIIITALIVGGGVYALQTISANKKIENLENQIKSLQDQLGQKTTQDNTADWQTYHNEAYGFEFKIPANYIVEETGIKQIWFSTNELLTARLKNVENCNDDRQETICEPEMVGSQLEFTAYFQFSENEKINKKIETINGISWQTFQTAGLYPTTYYEIENYGRQYHFTPHINKDEITKILSTFKFITNSTSLNCTNPPTSTTIGRDVYPIDTKYQQLEFLGQIFTAYQCGAERVNKIYGVNKGNYTLGSTILLKNYPGKIFSQVLQNIGYVCDETTAGEYHCKKWKLTKSVPVEKLMILEPYSDRIEVDDCVNCG